MLSNPKDGKEISNPTDGKENEDEEEGEDEDEEEEERLKCNNLSTESIQPDQRLKAQVLFNLVKRSCLVNMEREEVTFFVHIQVRHRCQVWNRSGDEL